MFWWHLPVSAYTYFIYCPFLFLDYFCVIAFQASLSFWIKIPHFGLYFLYMKGGLFLLSFSWYLSTSLSSLDFSVSELVSSTNVMNLPLTPLAMWWGNVWNNSGPRQSLWCPANALASIIALNKREWNNPGISYPLWELGRCWRCEESNNSFFLGLGNGGSILM